VTFLLDANVLLDFQNAGELPALVQAAQRVDMAIAEEVYEEVTHPKAGHSPELIGKKRQAKLALDAGWIRTIEILPGSESAILKQQLLAGHQTLKDKDRGEAASIAIAASDAGLLFVTGDKTAVLWALNELFHSGERVMRVPVFVRTLFDRGALPGAVVKRVAERAAGHGVPPSWWASWLGGL